MLDARLKEAAEFLTGLSPEDRGRARKQLDLLVASHLPEDELAVPVPVSPLGEYLARELPDPPMVVGTLVVRGELTVTVGKSGKGKTTMNTHRMLRWSAGLPMFDALPDVLVPTEPIKILAIENEGSAGMFQEKMQRMFDAEGYLPEKARPLVLKNFYVWGDGGYSGLKVDNEKDVALLKRALETVQPDILFVEPLRGIWRGNENDNSEVAEVLDRFQGLATDYGMAVVIAHHERKAGMSDGGDMMDVARGASALDGVVAAMENFRQVKGGDYRELSWSKARYGGAPAPIRMEYDKATGWYRYVAEGQIEREVLQFMQEADGDPVFVNEVAAELNEKETKVRDVMNRLVEDGRAKRTPRQFGQGIGYRLAAMEGDDSGGIGF